MLTLSLCIIRVDGSCLEGEWRDSFAFRSELSHLQKQTANNGCKKLVQSNLIITAVTFTIIL